MFTPRLFVYFRRRGAKAEDASDLTQVVWIRVLSGLARYDAGRSFTAWAFTIASRELIRWGQRERHRPITCSLPEDRLGDEPLPLVLPVHEEELALLRRCVEALSPTERLIVVQRFWAEQGYEAIALQIGQPAGALRRMCCEAISKLRRCMECGNGPAGQNPPSENG